MTQIQRTISPIDGAVCVERELVGTGKALAILEAARKAQHGWCATPLTERARICSRAIDEFMRRRDLLASEIVVQMGRPCSHAPGEIRGYEERARYMISLASEALADILPEPKSGFQRFIRREPLGVVLTLAPWNYPYLTAVNSVVPSLLAGNAVVLKHAAQTPLCAERMVESFEAAGLPPGVFQFLHASHEVVANIVASDGVDYVAFTGSVAGGHAVQRAICERFIGAGLELGGKDPAYVRPDAPIERTAEELVDGAFFNAGQSCCAVERIYVHDAVYEPFVDAYVERVKAYRLGDPRDPATTLGPVVRASAAEFVRGQIAEAVAAGARAVIDPKSFTVDAAGTPYLAPQVLLDVDRSMAVMHEESFGPVVGIERVGDDENALERMNDSRYGLTASIWTQDVDVALALGARLATGTVYVNRCDYLDPALAWTGVRDSGRGCTLSRVGFESLTRPKSFHARLSLG